MSCYVQKREIMIKKTPDVNGSSKVLQQEQDRKDV